MEVHNVFLFYIKLPLLILLSATLLQVTERGAIHSSALESLECHGVIRTGDCLHAIYNRYGNSTAIDFDQFKRFLGSIGLGGVGLVAYHMDEDEDHVDSHHTDEEEYASYGEDAKFGDTHTTDAHLHKCLSPRSLLAAVDLEVTDTLNVSHFLELCPILLQQLDVHACTNTGEESHDHHHDEDSDEDHATSQERHLREVWGFSIIAITVISLASIACILTLPCIQHYPVAFQRLLAFLIAVAVGTLSGDAIMHLIPHAFIPHDHDLHIEANSSLEESQEDHHGHESSSFASTEHLVILKGLAVLGGIFSFFLFEQILQYYSEKSSVRRKKDYKGLPTNHNRIGTKLSGYTVSENPESLPMVISAAEIAEKTPRKSSPSQAPHSSSIPRNHGTTKESSSYSELYNPSGGHSVGQPDARYKSHSENVENVEENIPCEGHHHHGHSHVMIEGSHIASVGWVVVLGDAMHNFCDGLVVGSAFVDSLAGGISTSIAIMCHEIPHELGDFAVMLKSGMSIKQALAFQGVSSVLAYIGMAVGVAVGNISSAATWMFALAAGMFLYIALVDLIPEMVDSTKSSKDNQLLHLVLQTAGVVLGCSIMLVIALKENSLLELLGG